MLRKVNWCTKVAKRLGRLKPSLKLLIMCVKKTIRKKAETLAGSGFHRKFMVSDVTQFFHVFTVSFFKHYIRAASGFSQFWDRVTSLFPVAGGFLISPLSKTATK